MDTIGSTVQRELALFAGSGGGILGSVRLGWRTVCAVEIDEYCRRVLVARQNDGSLAPFPVWDDIRTFDGTQWRGRVDVVSGGFPCQDISTAGRRAGISGERSGLWSEMARVIREVEPRFVFVENSSALTIRGLGRVLGDLASMGFDAEWGVLSASGVGAPHRRERIWIRADMANAGSDALEEREIWQGVQHESLRSGKKMAYAKCVRPHPKEDERIMEEKGARELCVEQPGSDRGAWWATEPELGRVAHGVAHRVDRLRAIGNGQVPFVAERAVRVLMDQKMRRRDTSNDLHGGDAT